MRALMFASVSAIALTLATAGVGYAAGGQENGSSTSTMSNSSMSKGSMSNGSESNGATAQKMSQSGEQSSAEVKEAQQKLKTAGLYQGRVDGIDGPQTRQALEQFQQKNGLQKTGRLDEQTLAKLNVGESGVSSGSSMPPSGNAHSKAGGHTQQQQQ